MKKPKRDSWNDPVALTVRPLDRRTTRSAHIYREAGCLELYVWTQNPMEDGTQVGVVRISRKALENYLREAKRRERQRKSRKGGV